MSEDPIGLSGGINMYSYTENDPVNYIDPLGLLTQEEWGRVRTEIVTWVGTPYNQVGAGSKKGKNADCSGSVWGIYNNAGFPYNYSPTKDFAKNPKFRKINRNEALPGDVVLWDKKHMSIYDPNASINGKRGNLWTAHHRNVKYGVGNLSSYNIKEFGKPVFYRYKN